MKLMMSYNMVKPPELNVIDADFFNVMLPYVTLRYDVMLLCHVISRGSKCRIQIDALLGAVWYHLLRHG